MNLILLQSPDWIADDIARLDDHRFRHICSILRASEGDTVRVGQLDGSIGTGEIVALDHQAVDLRISLSKPPPAKIPLTLVLALPRPKAMRRLLRTVAELGVEKLILLNTHRVEKSYWQTPLLDDVSMRDAFIEGLQQAGDTVLPTLQIEKRFRPFVEDQLPALAAQREALVAHPQTGGPCPQPSGRPTLLAVGPEGGFIPYEVEKLQHAGLRPVHIGERILKVETAVPVLVGKLFQEF